MALIYFREGNRLQNSLSVKSQDVPTFNWLIESEIQNLLFGNIFLLLHSQKSLFLRARRQICEFVSIVKFNDSISIQKKNI